MPSTISEDKLFFCIMNCFFMVQTQHTRNYNRVAFSSVKIWQSIATLCHNIWLRFRLEKCPCMIIILGLLGCLGHRGWVCTIKIWSQNPLLYLFIFQPAKNKQNLENLLDMTYMPINPRWSGFVSQQLKLISRVETMLRWQFHNLWQKYVKYKMSYAAIVR